MRHAARRKHKSAGADVEFLVAELEDVLTLEDVEELILALVRDRGWTPVRYERWVAEQLIAALLEPV